MYYLEKERRICKEFCDKNIIVDPEGFVFRRDLNKAFKQFAVEKTGKEPKPQFEQKYLAKPLLEQVLGIELQKKMRRFPRNSEKSRGLLGIRLKD